MSYIFSDWLAIGGNISTVLRIITIHHVRLLQSLSRLLPLIKWIITIHHYRSSLLAMTITKSHHYSKFSQVILSMTPNPVSTHLIISLGSMTHNPLDIKRVLQVYSRKLFQRKFIQMLNCIILSIVSHTIYVCHSSVVPFGTYMPAIRVFIANVQLYILLVLFYYNK